jgi:hypothetical protein
MYYFVSSLQRSGKLKHCGHLRMAMIERPDGIMGALPKSIGFKMFCRVTRHLELRCLKHLAQDSAAALRVCTS